MNQISLFNFPVSVEYEQKSEDLDTTHVSSTFMKKYIPTCRCAERDGYTTVLNNGVCVGITTQFNPDGVFVGNRAAWLENRFCPQCGAPRKVVEEENHES